MFDKRRDAGQSKEPAVNAGSTSYPTGSDTSSARSMATIGSTIRIKGEVRGGENMVIDGTIEGSVELTGHDLIIGQQGQVKADLKAKTVRVEGKVVGDIMGEEKVVITRLGRVLGNIVAPRVTLEDGSKFKGSIDMDPAVTQQAAESGGGRAPSEPEKASPASGKPEPGSGPQSVTAAAASAGSKPGATAAKNDPAADKSQGKQSGTGH